MFQTISSANERGLPIPYDWEPDFKEFWAVVGWLEAMAEEEAKHRKNAGVKTPDISGGSERVIKSNIPVDIEERMFRARKATRNV
jgi:hypothetical protein